VWFYRITRSVLIKRAQQDLRVAINPKMPEHAPQCGAEYVIDDGFRHIHDLFDALNS
jgi:hypothetical protein